MSISIVETTSGGADSIDLVLTLASAPTDGDLLVAAMAVAYNATVTPPAGWTAVTGSPFGSGVNPDARLAVFWKIASSEGTSFTFVRDTGDIAGAMLVASSTTGWQTTPEDQVANAYYSADVTSIETGLTGVTSQADELAVYMVGMSHYNLGSAIGWTVGTADESYYGVAAVYRAVGLAHQILTATGTQESVASWTNAVRASAAVATFMPSAASGTPFTLTPDGDGSRSVVLNEANTTTNLFASVDDSPDTPDTSNWLTTGEGDGYVFLDVSATPADFGSINNPLTVRAYLDSVGFSTDTCVVYAQMFASDETTPYTDEQQVGTEASTALVTADLTVNATGLAATKADWDAAKLRIRWDYTP